MQRQKTTGDIQALDAAKRAALEDTERFTQDLMNGQVGVEGDKLFGEGQRQGQGQGQDDSESSSSDSDSDSNGGEDRDAW
jgi:type IV secretory pathway TrbL component